MVHWWPKQSPKYSSMSGCNAHHLSMAMLKFWYSTRSETGH